MGIWQPQNLGANISQIVSADDAQDEAIRALERGGTAPTLATRPHGLLWNSTDATAITAAGGSGLLEAILRWDGSAWTLYADPKRAAINRHGTIAYAAHQPMGGFKLTGLAAGTASGDSVRYEQVLLLAGGTMTGPIAMGGHRITGLGAPTGANDAARLADLENAVPEQAAGLYYQTNRDRLGNSQPVILQQEADQAGTFTPLPEPPRRVTLRLYGRARRQDTNAAVAAGVLSGVEETFVFFDSDATGGDPGSAVVTKSMGDLDVRLERKASSPYGVYVRLQYAGIWVNLRKQDDADVDGSVHLIAEYPNG